jgi:PBP1b-binding outer membrane lipoprotein LpoB
MLKRISILAFAALLLTSCGNKSGKNTENAAGSDQAVKVEFASLIENPAAFVNKNVMVEGKVVHVCPHTGKKMFIVGENPDIMLQITAGENSPKFDMALQGSIISVEGKITQVITADKPVKEEITPAMETTAACCDSASKTDAACKDTMKVAGAECETEAALAKQPALKDLMMIYNKHTLVK